MTLNLLFPLLCLQAPEPPSSAEPSALSLQYKTAAVELWKSLEKHYLFSKPGIVCEVGDFGF